MIKILVDRSSNVFNLLHPLLANHTQCTSVFINKLRSYIPLFTLQNPALDLLTTRNRFVLPTKEDQCSLPNEKEKKNQKEREKKKKRYECRDTLP